ncbi:MAG: hypothetical protein RR423_09175 [Hydrogenoanaerobacterium sp.]
MSKYTSKKYEIEAILEACEQMEREAERLKNSAIIYEKEAKEENPECPEENYKYNYYLDNSERAEAYKKAAEKIYSLIASK